MKDFSLNNNEHIQLQFLAKTIVFWFEKFGRSFRWRRSDVDQYRVVLTELLLQRTRAETVAKFERHFFEKYKDWDSLYDSTEKD